MCSRKLGVFQSRSSFFRLDAVAVQYHDGRLAHFFPCGERTTSRPSYLLNAHEQWRLGKLVRFLYVYPRVNAAVLIFRPAGIPALYPRPPLDLAGKEWLEMPPTSSVQDSDHGTVNRSMLPSPTKKPADSKLVLPSSPGPTPSPGCRAKLDSAEILTRSPRRVKREIGGLREVRELIRRELELQG
ncbi:hypothetical protein DFH29DRAFT_873084 [Suillus ampliporus]|nr:hypothetical protein DFH29DRAFT_873084 [Suillus ampliporus]